MHGVGRGPNGPRNDVTGNQPKPNVAIVPSGARFQPSGHAIDPHNPPPLNFQASRGGHGAPVFPAIVPDQNRGDPLAFKGSGNTNTPPKS